MLLLIEAGDAPLKNNFTIQTRTCEEILRKMKNILDDSHGKIDVNIF